MDLKKIFNLFKRDNKSEQIDNSTKFIFHDEVLEIAKRYCHNDNYILKINQDETVLADFFSKEYQEWLELKNPSDKRRLIYSILDKYLWDKVELWEKAERLIESRQPIKAQKLLQENTVPEDNLEMYYATYAKLYIILHEYDKAIEEIIKGLAKFSNSKALKIQLADYYYSITSMERYKEVINELLKDIPQNNSSDITEIFNSLFSYRNGKLRSFSFAINFGFSLANPEQIKIFWEISENEFYYQPVFRIDHARYILENTDKNNLEDLNKVFAKYFFLVKEFPWQKEAADNALSLAKILKIKDERLDFIKKVIEDNGRY